MAYRALNHDTVVDYLRGVPALAEVIDLGAPLHAREVATAI